MKTYIHYGNSEFNPHRFKEISNRLCFSKPYGGLWASEIDSTFGWKQWCESEDFNTNLLNTYFEFQLTNSAKILRITNHKQLNNLTILKQEFYNQFNSFIYLDFVELSKQYDAIEVSISCDQQLYYLLYGWDCDSILIMNKDIIELI